MPLVVSLDDTSVTEWRLDLFGGRYPKLLFHSMIPVLLNGGLNKLNGGLVTIVSLDDTSVTEWRLHDEALENLRKLVSLDDTSVTEWRQKWI